MQKVNRWKNNKQLNESTCIHVCLYTVAPFCFSVSSFFFFFGWAHLFVVSRKLNELRCVRYGLSVFFGWFAFFNGRLVLIGSCRSLSSLSPSLFFHVFGFSHSRHTVTFGRGNFFTDVSSPPCRDVAIVFITPHYAGGAACRTQHAQS